MTTPHAESGGEGEGDVHRFARYALQKITAWLEANHIAATARAGGSNREVMKKLESAERYALRMMQGAVMVLNDEINPNPDQESK